MTTLTTTQVTTTLEADVITTTLETVTVSNELTIGPVTIGGATTITVTSPTSLSALRAIAWNGSHAAYADPAGPTTVLGITTSAGTTVDARYSGPMTDNSWSWSPGPIWLGANGALTQTPPTGAVVVLGRALNATTIIIEIEPPILRG